MSDAQDTQTVTLSAEFNDDKVDALFAWIVRVIEGDQRYSNMMYALVGVFGDPPPPAVADLLSDAITLMREDNALIPPDQYFVGPAVPLKDREQGSLGAMGAMQWIRGYTTRPHALVSVKNYSSLEDWSKGLPRNVRRTLAKTDQQNWTVTTKVIKGDEPAPHSTLEHFRCVFEHQVRVTGSSGDPNDFFQAVQAAISRFVNCISQAGEIREYRDKDGRVIAFAQEVTKGRTIRGQWFYATNVGAKNLVWFHSVRELVRRAIEDDNIDTADLGPSGTDASNDLKQRFGFTNVVYWDQEADYIGPFRYGSEVSPYRWEGEESL